MPGVRVVSGTRIVPTCQRCDTPVDLADRLAFLAVELVEPLRCDGTGLVITCAEEQAVADAAYAMHRAARTLRHAS